MLPILLKLIASPRALAVAAASAVVLIAGIQSLRLAHAKADLAIARLALTDPATGKAWRGEAVLQARSLASCQADNEATRTALRQQAAAVAALKAQSATADAAAAKALAAIRSRNEPSRALAAHILAAKAGVDACAAANSLILRSLEDHR